LHEKLQSLHATVERTVIKAPEAGMVLDLAVHTLGAVIPPGGKLLDIVPQNEKLLVEARYRRWISTASISPVGRNPFQCVQIAGHSQDRGQTDRRFRRPTDG